MGKKTLRMEQAVRRAVAEDPSACRCPPPEEAEPRLIGGRASLPLLAPSQTEGGPLLAQVPINLGPPQKQQV